MARSLFPWAVVDPAWASWLESDDEVRRGVLAALVGSLSVVMGVRDFSSLRALANSGTSTPHRELREALKRCSLRLSGSDLAAPDSVLAPYVDGSGTAPDVLVSLGGYQREAAREYLSAIGCPTPSSLTTFLLSTEFREVVSDRMRTFAAGDTWSEVWETVFEPFCRADRLNIYEPFVFRPFFEGEAIEDTGLYWFLNELGTDTVRTGLARSVVIRGTYRDRGSYGSMPPGQVKAVKASLTRLLDVLPDTLAVTLDVVDQAMTGRRVKLHHDRFWLSANNALTTRLMLPSNSVIQMASRRGGARVLNDTITISYSDRPDDIRPRESDWSRLSGAVGLSVSTDRLRSTA